MDPTFEFDAELWPWAGEGASWVFVTLPHDDGAEIRDLVPERRGFGSVKVTAHIGEVAWQTSIFPDKASGSYVLPIKKAVRSQAGVDIGDDVRVELDLHIT